MKFVSPYPTLSDNNKKFLEWSLDMSYKATTGRSEFTCKAYVCMEAHHTVSLQSGRQRKGPQGHCILSSRPQIMEFQERSGPVRDYRKSVLRSYCHIKGNCLWPVINTGVSTAVAHIDSR